MKSNIDHNLLESIRKLEWRTGGKSGRNPMFRGFCRFEYVSFRESPIRRSLFGLDAAGGDGELQSGGGFGILGGYTREERDRDGRDH